MVAFRSELEYCADRTRYGSCSLLDELSEPSAAISSLLFSTLLAGQLYDVQAGYDDNCYGQTCYGYTFIITTCSCLLASSATAVLAMKAAHWKRFNEEVRDDKSETPGFGGY